MCAIQQQTQKKRETRTHSTQNTLIENEWGENSIWRW